MSISGEKTLRSTYIPQKSQTEVYLSHYVHFVPCFNLFLLPPTLGWAFQSPVLQARNFCLVQLLLFPHTQQSPNSVGLTKTNNMTTITTKIHIWKLVSPLISPLPLSEHGFYLSEVFSTHHIILILQQVSVSFLFLLEVNRACDLIQKISLPSGQAHFGHVFVSNGKIHINKAISIKECEICQLLNQ